MDALSVASGGFLGASNIKIIGGGSFGHNTVTIGTFSFLLVCFTANGWSERAYVANQTIIVWANSSIRVDINEPDGTGGAARTFSTNSNAITNANNLFGTFTAFALT